MEFGDDDEGKILDLQGGEWNYCSYILQFCSLLTGKRYHTFDSIHENIFWLFSNKAIGQIRSAVLYDNRASRCFEVGGNTFLRDTSGRILVGMDHAALGFGRIAAHGHAGLSAAAASAWLERHAAVSEQPRTAGRQK